MSLQQSDLTKQNIQPLRDKQKQYQSLTTRSASMDSDNKEKSNSHVFSPPQNNPNVQNSFLFSEEDVELHDMKSSTVCHESPSIRQHKSQQPIFQFYVSLSVASTQISKVFLNITSKLGFTCIENEKNQILVLQQNKVTLKTYLMSCMLGQSNDDEQMCAIKMDIHTNTNSCTRMVTVKGLKGDLKMNHHVIQEFKNHIEQQRQQNLQQSNQHQLHDDSNQASFDAAFIKIEHNPDEDDEEEEHKRDPFTLESTANYMFQKILSQTAYGIGKKTHEYLEKFETEYSVPEESYKKLPEPIKEIMILINELVESLFSEHNYGKQETQQIMPYCKISVEKYVFQKVNYQLMRLYQCKFKEKEEQFYKKRQDIIEKKSIQQIFKFLDALPKFWLIKDISEKQNCKKEITISDEENKAIDLINSEQKPYFQAIQELSKIGQCQSPREKLKCIMMMRSQMRAGVIDFHNGREELVSMDDELPIVIYIILMCTVKNLFTELFLLEDFINQDPSIESEKRLLLNLQVSAQYIADEWKE